MQISYYISYTNEQGVKASLKEGKCLLCKVIATFTIPGVDYSALFFLKIKALLWDPNSFSCSSEETMGSWSLNIFILLISWRRRERRTGVRNLRSLTAEPVAAHCIFLFSLSVKKQNTHTKKQALSEMRFETYWEHLHIAPRFCSDMFCHARVM